MDRKVETVHDWLKPELAESVLRGARCETGRVREVLAKARELKGLAMDEVATLCGIATPDLAEELFATARQVKEEIYGRRMVLFAPLYISNVCGNDCTYCAFRSTNRSLPRTALDGDGIRADVRELVKQGHKRLLTAYKKMG